MNIWIGIIAGAMALGVWGLSKLSHAAGHIVTEVSARIFKLDISKITLAIDVLVKNPTNTEIDIQYPFVKLLHNGTALASSDIKNEGIKIRPFSQYTIKDIRIPISFLYMGSLAPEIIRRIKDKTHKITLQVGVESKVQFAGTSIPYSSTQDVTV